MKGLISPSVALSGLVIALLGPCLLVAQSVSGVSNPAIYVVDMQRILDQSIGGKAARNNVKAEAQKRDGKLLLMRREIEGLRTQVDKQSALLSPQALEERKDQLLRKQREFERLFSDEREAMAKFNSEEVSKLVRAAEGVIRDLARDNHYPLVLEKSDAVVVYVNKEFDVTDQVIKILDRKTIG